MTNKETFIANMKDNLGNIDFVNELADKLDKISFFTVPASINHHGNYEGGLYDHSWEVTRQLLYLTKRLDLTWNRPESPYIVGMLHDLCKCDNYKKSWSRRPNAISMGLGNDDGCHEEKWDNYKAKDRKSVV